MSWLSSVDWKQVASPLLTYLLTALVAYIVVPNIMKIPTATAKFFEWLNGKAKTVQNQYTAGVLSRACIVVRDHVLQLENTEIELLKERLSKGEIKKEDLPKLLEEVKSRAIQMSKEHFKATHMFNELMTIFLGNESALTKWLGDQVETNVAVLPPSGLQSNVKSGACEGKCQSEVPEVP